MKILFLHGWHSVPGGVKPTYLRDHGHAVLNPALPDDDFDAAVALAQAEFDRHRPDVVVGSSRGGAVAMNLNLGAVPLVLLCPAWKHWGAAAAVKPGTTILHSRDDEVIPFADSQELVQNSGLPESALIVVGTEHRLADEKSLAALLFAVEAAGLREQAAHGRIHEAGVPHRFGIGILMVLTTIFAVLFAILQTLQVPPLAFGLIGLFFGAVTLGQMLLFRGERPRMASTIVGGVFVPCVWLGFAIVEQFQSGPSHIDRGALCAAPFLIPVGMLAGYVAGLFVAAVFLFMDMYRGKRDAP